MSLKPGDHLGPYEILASIGRGGMGEVWKARDPRLDRIVAIKQLHGQHSARFQQEARAIAALNHPHICQIYDVGPDYLVLEYVEGKPLKGPLAPEQAWVLARQIASALEAAHAKGILHRDLKPGNILVTASGAKLLDFGLAKLVGDADATQTMGIAGTPLYMSPEQVEGKPLDTRSDVFSFGVVLYELLTGRRPFDSLASVVRDEPEPSGYEVIAQCLAKQPSQRLDSMTRVLALLREIEAKPASAQPSIAVLPFANMSRDADDEYFSDGLAEEIINALVKVPDLKVIARTSAFSFKGQNIDVRKIAETLGVTTVLEGSVRRAGSRIRVTAQLITAADGTHLWSERYDRELADVFAVQDEISAAISAALQLKLSPAGASRPRYKPTTAAYEALLKARHFHWKATAESMEQAQEFYKQAIALDPNYALAHTGYADYLIGRAVVALSPMREIAPLARALAQRAVQLDPGLGEAHSVLFSVASQMDFDWSDEADAELEKAMASGSVSPHCHFLWGWYALDAGRPKEAVAHLEQAAQGDPLHTWIRSSLGACLGAVGRFVEAEQQIRLAIQLDPEGYWHCLNLAELYAARGMFQEALPFAEKAYLLGPWSPPCIGIYAGVLMRTEQAERGRELAQQLGSGEAYASCTGWAIYHTCCEEIEQAAAWYEKATEQRDATAGFTMQSAIGHAVRASAHWPKIAAMRNLPA